MADLVIDIGDREWETTIERGNLPAIVMFHSPTCPYCRAIEPHFRELSKEYGDVVLFARLDVSVSPWTAERYGVMATPTFKFFCQGRPIQEMVGMTYPALLKRMIDEALLSGKECVQNSTVIDYDISGYA